MSVWTITYSPDDYQQSRLSEEFANANIDMSFKRLSKFSVIVNKTDQTSIIYDKINYKLPKCVLTRFGSKHSVTVPRHFEYAGIPVINNADSMLAGRDKFNAHLRWFSKNIPTPKTILYTTSTSVDIIENEIGFPCIVKPNPGSYGNGTHLCRTKQQFIDHFNMLRALEIKVPLMVQELIPDRAGCDLRVFVVGNKALGAMERIGPRLDDIRVLTDGEYGPRAKYKLTDKIESLAVSAANAVGLEITGVDLLFDGDSFKICEVNVCPGFETFEKNCNVNVAKAIVDLVKSKL